MTTRNMLILHMNGTRRKCGYWIEMLMLEMLVLDGSPFNAGNSKNRCFVNLEILVMASIRTENFWR